jgi:two-component system, cell cycle sensor histidine kinase and response regulator CckA
MGKPLNVLIVEDSLNDAELLVDAIHDAGYDLKWVRVETEPDYLAELKKGPDIVLSDYSMPQFSGLRAAELLRESGRDIPFILVSGTVGEDVAVDAMKRGATDYLLKDRLARLGQAIERALFETRGRVNRKETEQQVLIQSHALEAAANAILITDHTGKILWANKAFCALTGYALAEVLGQNPRFLKSGSHNAKYYEELWKTIAAGRVWQGEVINRRKDGTIYYEEMTITPVRANDGQVTHFVAVKQDTTERRKLEEQFRQAQKMDAVGRLAGGVAHDFNNILAVIQMQCDLMNEKEISEEHKESMKEIAAAARRATTLVRQLLLFSRKEVMQLHDLDLNESINHMTKMLRRILGEDIHLQFQFASQPLVIHGDAGMVDQVLMNLVVNSRDAMPHGGELVIGTSAVEIDELMATWMPNARPGSFACVKVRDKGSGIAPENLPRIFEPFFTTKEPGKGTGLGLATVFGIVQQHKGWISVKSELGKGTTFKIYFPRLAKVPEPQLAPPTAALQKGHETILVVEDDAFVRMTLAASLTQLGYKVVEAVNGADALNLWAKHRMEISLMLTDLIMPGGMSGRKLAEQLLRDNPKLKVIYVSGYHTEIDKEFRLEAGVNYLVKPFQAEELAAIVRGQLEP